MILDPLHPAVVHFPIVLATLLPLFAAWGLFSIRRGTDPRRAWAPVVLVAALLTASTFAATATGEAQEERVEAFVPESAFEEHEEAGERLRLLAALVTLLLAAGFIKDPVGIGARWISGAATLIVLAAAVQVGHTGGELVYRHGAAAAYVDGVPQQGGSPALPVEGRREDDDSH